MTSKFFENKFDLIVSLGEDCACSSYLRRFNLQDYTYPFDWLTRASFSTRIELLCNNFENFLIKENIVRLEFPFNTRENTDEEDYEDIYLKFNFYHDFKKNLGFDENFTEVKTKYNRRIERFYSLAKNSNKILFVWWGRSYNIELKEILDCYNKICSKFSPSQIFLLIIECSAYDNQQSFNNEHVYIARYDNLSFKDNPRWNETMGNESNNNKFFKNIKKNREISWFFKYYTYKVLKILLELIPIKNLRSKYKKQLRYIFFRARL